MPANWLGESSGTDINGLLAHTTNVMNKKGVLMDAVCSSIPLYDEIRKSGNLRDAVSGGYMEEVPLMYGLNETFGWYKRYGQLNNDPQDGMGMAYFPVAQASITVSIDGLSELQNAGAGRKMDLVKSKMVQATKSAAEKMNVALWDATAPSNGETADGGKSIIPLPMLVDADADRSLSVGGIDGSTHEWWQNQALDYGGSHTAPVFRRKIRDMKNTIIAEGGGEPDLIIMDKYSHANYEAATEYQKRYTSSDRATAGFGEMYHGKSKVIWDPMVPDPEYSAFTGANYSSSNWAAGAIYVLSTEYLGLRIWGGRDWKFQGWKDQLANNQDARQNTALFAGQLICTNRRMNGVIYGVTSSTIAESA